MSRVEPKEERPAQEKRHEPVDRHPEKAEGDEKTVEEALRRASERSRPED